MIRHRALVALLCFHFTKLICAASLRYDDSGKRQLEAPAQADQPVSLLTIMKKLQVRVNPRPAPVAVASEVQMEATDGQTAHERQLLADMGRLESQLESWKQAEQSLEHQVSDQSMVVQTMKDHEAKALLDEQFAASVWWDCKMFMCLVLVGSLGFCIVATGSDSILNKTGSGVAEPPQETAFRVRPQPEFVEKNLPQQVEDTLEVPVPQAMPAAHVDRESSTDVVKKDVVKKDVVQADLVEESGCEHPSEECATPRSDTSKCQYFNMAEDPPEERAEESWSAAY